MSNSDKEEYYYPDISFIPVLFHYFISISRIFTPSCAELYLSVFYLFSWR